ncbi:MAG: iron-containing redox enzyme family protein [bacterium]|nr:iron-containing redox enzyme family protein [bacterium]
MPTSSSVTVEAFDDLIASRSLLLHPFYVKWNAGELSMDDMQVYAKEYFQLAKRIPGIVGRVLERAGDRNPAMKAMIAENMKEEQEHVELWKRFACSVGVSNEELENYVPSAKVHEAVSELEAVTEGTFEDGVTAMYAMEKELPAIAQSKKDGLCKFYALTTEDAHIYFDEHLGEEKHLRVWMTVDLNESTAKIAAEKSLSAQNKVLDAVCDLAGIDMDCGC